MRHDQLQDPSRGPDDQLATDLEPSRGQLATIAHLACELLGQPLTSRLQATVAITRLRLAIEDGDVPAELVDVEPVVPF